MRQIVYYLSFFSLLFLFSSAPLNGEVQLPEGEQSPRGILIRKKKPQDLPKAESPARTEEKKQQAFPKLRYIVANGRRYINLSDVARYYGMSFGLTPTGAVLLAEQKGANAKKIQFTDNKRIGSIDGVTVHFLFPLFMRKGMGYISEIDFRSVLDPALTEKTDLRTNFKTIMIDPGHGGDDPGAKGPVLSEKAINLQIALRLKKILESSGFTVIMTRTGDTFPSLQARAELCEKIKPDFFISIHCNSAETKTVTGIETFVLTPVNAASTGDKKLQTVRTKANAYDANSYRFAFEFQKAIGKHLPKADDRGVKHARFYVLRNAVCPAVLIETGFLSNYTEGRKMATQDWQNGIINSILSAMSAYAETLR